MSLDNVADIYPLTPMQRLMLMHSLRSPGSSTLVNQFRFRLLRPLDTERFASAWRQVLSRHDVLRTAFIWDDVPQPLQVVRQQVALPFDIVDLSEQPAADRSARRESVLRADREAGFDLRRAPLMRLTLIHEGDDTHLFVLSRHHLILDLWSAQIVFDEVFALYRASGASVLPAAGRFRSYLAWLESQDGKRAEAYWRHYLDGFDTPSLLFGPHATRSRWTAEGQSSVERTLEPEVAAALEQRARALGLTSATLLEGALALVISILCDKRDVAFGLAVSGRPAQIDDVERIVGSFINNVPLRAVVDDEANSVEWLGQLQRVHSERADFEHVSPIDLHGWSGLPADSALFDLLVLLQAPISGASSLGAGLVVEPLRGPMDSAFPITLAVETAAGDCRLTAVHGATDVVADVAGRLVEALAAAIGIVSQGVPERLGDLRHRIAAACPPPATDSARRVAALPEACARTPSDAPASADATRLLEIFRRAIGNPAIGLDDDFFAVGGTSIQAAAAFARIEQEFGKPLPLSTLFSAGSVRRLMQVLELPPAPASSLVSIQRFGRRPPIVAVSGIGGNVVGLAGLARALGDDQPLFGLQPRALDSDARPPTRIEEIAAAYVAEAKGLGNRPLVLLGVCFGANVAIEMAHQLEAGGQRPALVVVLDPAFEEPTGGSAARRPATETKLDFVGHRLARMVRGFRQLEGAQRRAWLRQKWSTLLDKIRHRDLFYGDHRELRQRRVEAANLAAARSYRPRPYGGAIEVLLTRDRDVQGPVDPRDAWRETMRLEIPPVSVPGADTGDALSRHPVALAQQLRRWIDRVGKRRQEARDGVTNDA
ncbi:MAG: hypothetical protein KDH20_08155 [Rhodocyclaceae bacterium]|nr:hypothetical protein [Rhodocyclaceae bacterium]